MGRTSIPEAPEHEKRESIIYSFIIYKNKKHRDQVNKKVMKDLEQTYENKKDKKMPFAMETMAYGGFEMIVDF